MSDSRTDADADGVRRLAERQHGVVSREQLRDHGLSDTMVARWLGNGRLLRLHRGVFALGHTTLSLKGRLWAALLYADPDAVLSHTTAAWIWSLIEAEPARVHITVAGRRRSLPDVRVHHSRQVAVVHYRGFPVTPVARTLVDLATTLSAGQIRRALAEADFRGLLDPVDAQDAMKSGRPGSKALRAALRSHLPSLAETLSVLEERFLELCERAHLRIPEMNARVGRMRVDALWREERIAVELDGAAAHRGYAAIRRDRRREVALRAAGFQVVRYSWDLVAKSPEQVILDLRRLLIL